MAEFIDECAIPVSIVGLLYALPNTQLTRRLAREGRLHEGHDVMLEDRSGDQCSLGINFEPKRPLREILTDYKLILEQVFEPAAYARRLDRLTAMLDRSGRPERAKEDIRLSSLHMVSRILDAMPGGRDMFWKTFMNCARNNPGALRSIVSMMAIYVHLGPFARSVIAEINRRIAVIEEGRGMPGAAQVTAAEAATARSLATGSSLH